MILRFVDSAPVSGIRTTSDGYKVAEVPVARTGIQVYAGYEVGKPEMAQVRMYRPPEAVFADSYIQSIAHKPVTDDHPKEGVNARNWKELASGYTGDTIRKDEANGLIYVPLLFADQAVIDKLEAGKREVSCGYTCEVEWTAGVTDSGEHFDAIQRPQALNHVALVNKGRAGYACRVGDTWTPIEDNKEPSVALKTIKIASVADGLPFEATDAAEAVINKLVTARDAALERAAGAERDLNDAKANEATLEGKITALEASLADAKVTPEKLAKLVADRAALVADAKKIAPDMVADGLDDDGIRAAAVKVKLGDKAPTDAARIAGAFDVLLSQVSDSDGFREVAKDGFKATDGAEKANSAWENMKAGLEVGYKSKAA